MSRGNVPLESLLRASDGSIYKLAVLAAKRAIAISNGDKTLVENPKGKALDNAIKEIQSGKIKVKGKEKK